MAVLPGISGVAGFNGDPLMPVIESSTVSSGDGGTTLTVVMPATRPDGDLYIAFCMKDDDPDWSGIPGNWTSIHTDNEGAGSPRYHAWWWIGSSEPATYTLTSDDERAISVVVRISGADSINPIHLTGITTGSSSNASAPDITTTLKVTLVLRAMALDGKAVTGTPATTLEMGSSGGDSTNRVGYAVSAADGPNPAGATGTAQFTHNSDTWVSATIAIKPV